MSRRPADYSEAAVVKSTGESVRVLRRRSVAHDEQIMRALELAGNFVIGTPQGFRYRRPRKRKFTRPEAAAVFLIAEDGTALAALPGPYFYDHYRITREDHA